LRRRARTAGWCAKHAKDLARPSSSTFLPSFTPDVIAGLERAGIERPLLTSGPGARVGPGSAPRSSPPAPPRASPCASTSPTLDALCRDAFARALYLYPTKALSQDQARALGTFGLSKQVRPAIYDGDTPRDARGDVRRRANVVLTNPDMLHLGILPTTAPGRGYSVICGWWSSTRAHVYRGVLRFSCPNVLRRLLRVAAAYGSEVRVLLASATIANPVELAQRLTGLDDIGLIDGDGSPTPRPADRDVEPPRSPTKPSARGAPPSARPPSYSPGSCARGRAGICFMKSRKGVELLRAW